MPVPSANFNDVIVTSLQGYSGTITDQIINHNALLRKMSRDDQMEVATGRTIVQELEYAENSTVMWYTGGETLDVSESETFTAAEFSYKQLAGHVTINGLEEIQNSGREAIHNLLKARIKNLTSTLKNTVATALYAPGTGSGGKEFGGLQLLVPDVNTNTVGGIDANAQTWWRNYVYDFSTAGVTASSTTIQHALNDGWINTINGADKCNLIMSGSTYWMYYLESLQVNQRFSDDKGAGAGFSNMMFMGNVPIVYDDQCAATRMYMLQTPYIHLRPAKGRWMKTLGDKASVNQDAIVVPVVTAGNMTISNRSRQAVICA